MKILYKRSTYFFLTFLILSVSFIFYFNRSPERNIPEGDVIVSPATGDVIRIEKADTNEISFLKKGVENSLVINGMKAPYNIIVIEMDPTDVHVQRSPIQGELTYQEHFSGKHQNALWSKDVTELANENEKNIIIVENEKISVGVIQVAGIMARRIVSFVSPAQILKKGEIYGRIKLGSQVVVIIPEDLELEVSLGDTLADGETVLARY